MVLFWYFFALIAKRSSRKPLLPSILRSSGLSTFYFFPVATLKPEGNRQEAKPPSVAHPRHYLARYVEIAGCQLS